MKLNKDKILNFTPTLGLIALMIVYYISMNGQIAPYNLKILLNQIVITAIVGIGAVFIFSIGAFDISLGASTAVSAMCGVLVMNRSNSIAFMLITTILVGVFIGLFNSLLASFFNLPAFVTTIVMLSVLGSVVEFILKGQSQIQVDASLVKPYDNVMIKAILLALFFALALFIQHYTKLGRQNNFLGDSPISAKQSGLNQKKLTIIVFVLAGVGVGIGAFLTILRAPVLGKTTAASVGMDVLMAIVFGGMPLSGGSKTKISSALIGATSIVFLNQILAIMGLTTGLSQAVKAILFIVVVYIASIGYRDKHLPR